MIDFDGPDCICTDDECSTECEGYGCAGWSDSLAEASGFPIEPDPEHCPKAGLNREGDPAFNGAFNRW